MAFPWSYFGVYCEPLDDDLLKRRDWCFNSSWLRTKTSTSSINVILLHRSNWLLCPVHAISCHAATLLNPSDYVYGDLRGAGKNSITSLNSTFKRIQSIHDSLRPEMKPEQYTKGLTSHCIRGGAEQ